MLYIIDSALKHGFSEGELRAIWENVSQDSVVRVRHNKQPSHYMMLGRTKNNQLVELIAYTNGFDWFLFHAQTPPTTGFKQEYFRNGGIL